MLLAVTACVMLCNTAESSEEASGSDEDVASWISWFCSLKGNEFFCEVEGDFIQEDFNLSGLSSLVSVCSRLWKRKKYVIILLCLQLELWAMPSEQHGIIGSSNRGHVAQATPYGLPICM